VCCTSTCPLAEIENNTVCTITGVVVKTITYDKDEYLTTATCDDSNKTSNTYALSQPNDSVTVENSSKYADTKTAVARPVRTGKSFFGMHNKKRNVSHCINFHQRVCMEVLCSEITTNCYEKERNKLRNRLRWSFMRHVRSFKMKHRGATPNMLIMISNISKDIENYRVPIMNDTTALRRQLANSCAQDIFKFTCSMTESNALFTQNLDAKTLIIGLFYLLRSGLVHRSITILPRCRSLAHLLPPENYINQFGVKSKIITETENIVKCHLRTLSDSDIKDIGYEAFDRLVQ
jgi:hypothetical protein